MIVFKFLSMQIADQTEKEQTGLRQISADNEQCFWCISSWNPIVFLLPLLFSLLFSSILTGIFHPKMKILSSFTYTPNSKVVPNKYTFLSSAKQHTHTKDYIFNNFDIQTAAGSH